MHWFLALILILFSSGSLAPVFAVDPLFCPDEPEWMEVEDAKQAIRIFGHIEVDTQPQVEEPLREVPSWKVESESLDVSYGQKRRDENLRSKAEPPSQFLRVNYRSELFNLGGNVYWQTVSPVLEPERDQIGHEDFQAPAQKSNSVSAVVSNLSRLEQEGFREGEEEGLRPSFELWLARQVSLPTGTDFEFRVGGRLPGSDQESELSSGISVGQKLSPILAWRAFYDRHWLEAPLDERRALSLSGVQPDQELGTQLEMSFEDQLEGRGWQEKSLRSLRFHLGVVHEDWQEGLDTVDDQAFLTSGVGFRKERVDRPGFLFFSLEQRTPLDRMSFDNMNYGFIAGAGFNY